ncbi:Asp23/Gls24 family envelope stress response protein [Streptomyces sp. NPDC097619]|uniref:Asp23/Gls24 family envelope stress response protein n=1 Tax=Streptomyces sp. NPDC097619 TaxID=3157228 RepID=UPI003322A845
MKSEHGRALDPAVTDAVLATPGVACLRPGLRDLLRAAAPGLPAGRDLGQPGSGVPASAVRLARDARGRVTGLQVDVVVRAHRHVLDTARAVRTAAAEAAGIPPESVRVTVTGIV